MHSTTLPARLVAGPRPGTALPAFLARVRAAWQRRAMQRATHEALNALDAHLLHDLGLDRSEIVSVAVEIADLATPLQVERAATRRRVAR